jgi:hypothetical protein
MNVRIVTDQGTHLLIADRQRYAVIERRNDCFYNCHDDKRTGIPANDLSGIERILDESDWTSKEAAEAIFHDIVARGSQLAQRML